MNGNYNVKKVCKSLKETVALAHDFATFLRTKSGVIILFDAPMGAGKTTFTSVVVRALDKNATAVTSPTFTIINQYAPNIFHVDLYRLNDSKELQNTDFADITKMNNYTFIEWADKCNERFEGHVFKVKIEIKDNARIFSIREA